MLLTFNQRSLLIISIYNLSEGVQREEDVAGLQ
jgi:hypothetical protein